MELPPIIISRVRFVAAYIGTESTKWTTIKHQIERALPSDLQGLFSRRHESTHQQMPSEFDYAIIALWKELTGVELEVNNQLPPDWKPQDRKLFLNRGRETYADRQRKTQEDR